MREQNKLKKMITYFEFAKHYSCVKSVIIFRPDGTSLLSSPSLSSGHPSHPGFPGPHIEKVLEPDNVMIPCHDSDPKAIDIYGLRHPQFKWWRHVFGF